MTDWEAEEWAVVVSIATLSLVLVIAAVSNCSTRPTKALATPPPPTHRERMIDPMQCTHCARLDRESDQLAEQVRSLSDTVTACMSAEESPFKAERDRLAAQVEELAAALIKAQKPQVVGAQHTTQRGGVTIDIRDIPWMTDKPTLRVVEGETE